MRVNSRLTADELLQIRIRVKTGRLERDDAERLVEHIGALMGEIEDLRDELHERQGE